MILTFALAVLQIGAPLTPGRALDRRRLSGLEASPDLKRVAFVVSEPAKGTKSEQHIYVADVAGGARQFTASSSSEWSPRWSPDGGRLAFLSDRAGKPQIWIMATDGGESCQLTDVKTSISRFEWAPGGKRIAYLAAPPKSEEDEKREKDGADAKVVDSVGSETSLWLFDVEAKTSRQVTKPPWRVDDIAWLPDGDRLVIIATKEPAKELTSRIYTIDAAGGEPAQISAPKGPFSGARVSLDGRLVAYLASRVDGPTPHDLFVQPIGGGPAVNLTAKSVDRPVSRSVWLADGSMLVMVQDGFIEQLGRLERDGSFAPMTGLPAPPNDFARSETGMFLIGEQTARPPELWHIAGGQASRLSYLNRSWDTVKVAEPEMLKYRSFDGTMIEGALLVPPRRVIGTPVPLVVIVHGGPTGAWSDRFETWGQLLAARGYAVFYPNIRGSTGYGWSFLTSNRNDWGGGDYKDVMVGVDTLIGRGVADPDRLGIAGWSYGGYLASWAVTQTGRFKAAVTGAGMSDLATEYGTEGGPSYDEWFFGTPYEKPENFRKSSPLTHITSANTPTLILQGEADVTDPISQSQMLYRALRKYDVPAELVLYPREGHGLREEKHLIDRLDRIIEWFDRWMRP